MNVIACFGELVVRSTGKSTKKRSAKFRSKNLNLFSSQREICLAQVQVYRDFAVIYTQHSSVNTRRVTLHPVFPVSRCHANPSLIRHSRRTLILTNITASIFRTWRILHCKHSDRDLWRSLYSSVRIHSLYSRNRRFRFDLGQSVWDLCWTKWQWAGVSPSTPVFHCQYHSINIPYSHFIILPPTMYNLRYREYRQRKHFSVTKFRRFHIAYYTVYTVEILRYCRMESRVSLRGKLLIAIVCSVLQKTRYL